MRRDRLEFSGGLTIVDETTEEKRRKTRLCGQRSSRGSSLSEPRLTGVSPRAVDGGIRRLAMGPRLSHMGVAKPLCRLASFSTSQHLSFRTVDMKHCFDYHCVDGENFLLLSLFSSLNTLSLDDFSNYLQQAISGTLPDQSWQPKSVHHLDSRIKSFDTASSDQVDKAASLETWRL